MRRRNVVETVGRAGVVVSLGLTTLSTQYDWVRLLAAGALLVALASWMPWRRAGGEPPVTTEMRPAGPLPAGQVPVLLPVVGEGVDSAVVTGWLVGVGEPVRRNDPLVEISTDKVDAELPAPATGTVAAILVPVGSTVPPGATLAVISTIG